MSSRSNSIIIDWFSMTTKIHSPEEVIEMLGMSDCKWSQLNGARGYQDRYWFDSISIHYNGRSDMGVWLEMSGQGCRAFKSYGNGDYTSLFTFAIENLGPVHITRIDIAFDEYKGILDMNKLCKHTTEKNTEVLPIIILLLSVYLCCFSDCSAELILFPL